MKTQTLLTIALLLTACNHQPATPPTPEAKHHHQPPHGGTLIELGDEVGHFELLLDKDTGRLTAYALDAHADQPIRLKNPHLPLTITPNGAPPIPITLDPIANPLTGETLGDTSQFEATIPALKGADTFTGTLPPIQYRGIQLPQTPFTYPSTP